MKYSDQLDSNSENSPDVFCVFRVSVSDVLKTLDSNCGLWTFVGWAMKSLFVNGQGPKTGPKGSENGGDFNYHLIYQKGDAPNSKNSFQIIPIQDFQ